MKEKGLAESLKGFIWWSLAYGDLLVQDTRSQDSMLLNADPNILLIGIPYLLSIVSALYAVCTD